MSYENDGVARLSLIEKIDTVATMVNSEWVDGKCSRSVRDAVASLSNLTMRFYDQREFYRAEASKTLAHRDEKIIAMVSQTHETLSKGASEQTGVLREILGQIAPVRTAAAAKPKRKRQAV